MNHIDEIFNYGFDCFENLSHLYSSLKKTWPLLEIYRREKLKGVRKFQNERPQEFKSLLHQKININDGDDGDDDSSSFSSSSSSSSSYRCWIKPGYLIARHGPRKFFEYIAPFVKEDPVHSDGYTLLHAVTPVLDSHIREPRIIYLIDSGVVSDVNVLDNHGRSCLFYLRRCGGGILDFLERRGVDFCVTDNYGLCPAEYRYMSVMFDYCPYFFKKNSSRLLKKAIEVNDSHLVSLVLNHVDISRWPLEERLKVLMLRSVNIFYWEEAAIYLTDVIPAEVFEDGERLFRFIDDYLSETFGPESLERTSFVSNGLNKYLIGRYDTRMVCFRTFTDHLLRHPGTFWYDFLVNVTDFCDLVPSRLEYARRFQSVVQPIENENHWLYILNWLYVSRNDDDGEEYRRLLENAVRLKDVSNNTALHFIAKYDNMLCNEFLAYRDFEWIEKCILHTGGADVDAVNDDKETPLFVALRMYVTSWEDTTDFCKLLVKYGAHLDVINRNGEQMEHLLKNVLGMSFNSPRPLQCLAAKKCNTSPHLPKIINKIIDLH